MCSVFNNIVRFEGCWSSVGKWWSKVLSSGRLSPVGRWGVISVGCFSLGDNRHMARGRRCSDGTRRVSEGDRTGSGVDVALLI